MRTIVQKGMGQNYVSNALTITVFEISLVVFFKSARLVFAPPPPKLVSTT